MCFSEFIGYTCGHSSAEVLRPCPMTTQQHTNPLCARHARRPMLVPEMCPACQRVLHGRAVLITEWEHRWMHERGVCGCEVRFPDLFRPRVAGRENGAAGPGGGSAGRGGAGGRGGSGGGGGQERMTLPRVGGNSKTGAKNVPALYQETLTARGAGGGKKPEVAIRIPSFYGAEWVDEHRQLHLKGSCKCPGDFSFYQTPASYQVVPSSSAHHSREQVVRMAGPQSPQGRTSQYGTMPTYINPQQHSKTRNSRPSNSKYSHPQRGTHTQGNHPPQQAPSHQVRTGLAELHQHSAYPGQAFNSARGTAGTSLPPRSPGAIHEVDTARSTNKLYNFACSEGAKITSCADVQSVDFPKPSGVLPLVGLPIGAGPEGPAGLPHTGDFSLCVLHVGGLIASLGEPRPLRRKSNSISCLHEFKMTKKYCDPAEHTQSAPSSAESSDNEDELPGEAEHTQNPPYSAESSDNEDEVPGENRL